MAALGLIAGLFVVTRAARREGIDPDKAWNLGIIAILASMVGSKLLMILNDWEYYSKNPSAVFSLATLQAYGVFYGGVVTPHSFFLIFFKRGPGAAGGGVRT